MSRILYKKKKSEKEDIANGFNTFFTNVGPQQKKLTQFSNILEKLYNNRLDKFIDKCNILSPSQYGFRSSMSTTEALLDLVEEITTSLEQINTLLEYLLT